MRVRQSASLDIMSETITAITLTEIIGLEADRQSVRGSRNDHPDPLPRFHRWSLSSGLPDTATVNDQLDGLMQRMHPRLTAIKDLLTNPEVGGGISVVRHFEEGPETEQVAGPGRTIGSLERLAGQHPLLGFHLGDDVLAFVADLGIGLDFDEYGPE